jgi:hypothetical protein
MEAPAGRLHFVCSSCAANVSILGPVEATPSALPSRPMPHFPSGLYITHLSKKH